MNKVVDYVVSRCQENPKGCSFSPRTENVRFTEISNGERVCELLLQPEEAKSCYDVIYGKEKLTS